MTDPLGNSEDLDDTIPLQTMLKDSVGHPPHFPSPDELGALLPKGAYQVQRIIGQGGMGAVYHAIQCSLKRPVAIKVMRRDQGQNYNFEQRFEREALAMAELNHPNIVNVFDFGEVGEDYLYIVMEYVDGADLMEVIRSGRMTQKMALTLLLQICDALQFAHNHGIVHRDIKPSNILLSSDGRVKIADFGLAKRSKVENSFVTLAGTGMGTPDYAAPEQFDAKSDIDHRADIYALGVMIYQMLTGHLPRGVWKPPSERAEVVKPWDDIVRHATHADPKDRYQSAGAVKTDISSIVLAEGDDDSSTARVAQIPAKSRRSVMVAAFSVLAVLGVGAFLATRKTGETPNHGIQTIDEKGGYDAGFVSYNVTKIGARADNVERPEVGQTFQEVVWEDGTLVIGKPGGRGQIFDYRPLARDAILRAEVQFEPGASSPHLSLRNQGGENHGTFYRLWVEMNDPVIKLAFVRNFAKETLIKQWPLSQVRKGPDWLSLELRTIGNQITAVVDGEVLGTFTNEGILIAGGYQIFSQGRSHFRNVEYIVLDPPPVPSKATKEAMFVNSLGMKFAPVPIHGGPTAGKRVLFSIWEVREKDYQEFVSDTNGWWTKDPEIDHGLDHPATSIAWPNAVAFSAWLTERERKLGKIGANETFRLPSDHEWSCAVGIGEREDPNAAPSDKRIKIKNVFPWGATWPPPSRSGNFWSEELRPLLAVGKFSWVKAELTGYEDGYATLAPVGKYPANRHGLHDLAGNVGEWCSDWFDSSQTQRVVRGSDWSFVGEIAETTFLSSYRYGIRPELRQSAIGFRVVLEVGRD